MRPPPEATDYNIWPCRIAGVVCASVDSSGVVQCKTRSVQDPAALQSQVRRRIRTSENSVLIICSLSLHTFAQVASANSFSDGPTRSFQTYADRASSNQLSVDAFGGKRLKRVH